MLLPPALDCAPTLQPMRSAYATPRTVLSPPPNTFHQPTASPVFNTCRTLQSLLTNTLAQPSPMRNARSAPSSLANPIDLSSKHSPEPQKPPQQDSNRAPTPTNIPPTTPPPSKKRRRSDPETAKTPTYDTTPSTPKRTRLHPPTLPQGLSRADFESLQLQEEAAAIPLPQTPVSSTSQMTPNASKPASSPDSDALASLIMLKLRLRQNELDKCACQKLEGRYILPLKSRRENGRRDRALLGLRSPHLPIRKAQPLT